MLTVSLVGKKFSCNIQLQISAEKDGGGLELALKAGEKCSNRPQAVSNVTASLNITIQRGCKNYVTKCKEMLMFLQEQALPKTMNIMKVHMVNRETKNLQKDESKLFSCIRPNKRDRERARERSTSRDRWPTRAKRKRFYPPDGYSSDSEQLHPHSYAASTDSLSIRQSSRTDIIATPRMSRHRLKNAALLRDRKQREASREKNETIGKMSKQQESKTKNTSFEIHLPVTEPDNSKSIRQSLRSLETDIDSQGEIVYEGGSESSLRVEMEKDGKENKGIKNNHVQKSENFQSDTAKKLEKNVGDSKCIEDSDMSVDSLECLDTSSKDLQEKKKKKKKKRKTRKRAEEKASKADVESSPSVDSQIPSLALPEDFHDSSVECTYSDSSTVEKHDATNSTSSLSSVGLYSDEVAKMLRNTAQQLVDEIVQAALKKCGKPTCVQNVSKGNELKDHASASVQPCNDEAIKCTKPREINLNYIEDKPTINESIVKKLINDSKNLQESNEASCAKADNGFKGLYERKNKNDFKEEIFSCTDAVALATHREIPQESDLQKRSSSHIETVYEAGVDDAIVSSIHKESELQKESSCEMNLGNNATVGVTEEESDLQEKDSSSQIKLTSDQNNSRCSGNENEASKSDRKELYTLDRCSAAATAVKYEKNDKQSHEVPASASEVQKASSKIDLNFKSKAETSIGGPRNESSSLSSKVEQIEQREVMSQLEPLTYPVRLYDTNQNITNRIIHSVTQALNLRANYTTPNQTTYITFDPGSPQYHTTPERGLEGYRKKELHSNNKNDLKDFQPQQPQTAGKQTSNDEKSRARQSRNQKSEETFQRFVQSQRFAASVGPGSNVNRGTKSDSVKPSVTYINTSKEENPKSGFCFFMIGSDPTSDAPQNLQQYSSDSHVSTDEEKVDLDTTFSLIEPRINKRSERPKSSVYHRSLSDQNERKKWHTSIQEPDLLRTVHQRSLSAEPRSRSTRANKCISCPVLSEEDIVLEGLESHHKDVCNSLSQRTWVVLRVHELWKAKKPLEALKTCMELTGIKATDVTNVEGIGSNFPVDTTGSKDNALFLNILLQLPCSCSAWSLNMCDLLLPELKPFISTRRHTSHVDMACNVIQVIVKKISGVVLKVQTGNKEKPDLLKSCVSHLRDVSDRISQVLVARRGRTHVNATEDPIALKPVLRELLSTIQTLLRVYVD